MLFRKKKQCDDVEEPAAKRRPAYEKRERKRVYFIKLMSIAVDSFYFGRFLQL